MGTINAGTELLDEVEAFLRRFVAFPSEAAAVATTLWAAHAHLLEGFDSTPRLAFLSPEPGSGKTRALEILETLVPNPMLAVNATPAALFRAIGDADNPPTVLFDEIDTVFGPKAKDNEDLRGLINAGHRRSGVAYRCVGDGSSQAVVAFKCYAAIALGGLGELPDTVLTRSVIIRMRRRAPHEKVTPYRARLNEPEGHALRARLSSWAATVADVVREAFPDMPEGVNDRPADVWEPLLSVADAAGGEWPERGRKACVELVAGSTDPSKVSLGVRLLADLRTVFTRAGQDKLPGTVILSELAAMDDAPWAELGGKGLDSRALARLLKPYTTAQGEPIKPRTVRTSTGTPKGYHAADLADAWARYLPQHTPNPVEGGGPVSATRHGAATQSTSLTCEVSDVAVVADFPEADTRAVEKGPCLVCGAAFQHFGATPHPHTCATCHAQGRTPAQAQVIRASARTEPWERSDEPVRAPV
ncbi:DUF3631 domain-containing protein [Nocardiopsis sp. EMB25]|uniref:DUF3631 domain-containing protein n=1 Tax=Nocardiopsis sp. EMB25 TaxID=2835867 RepID=UPI00228470AE|nr:DUF3631 domain-containing protein [Nocardiopsis sp. EMB25]MCY9787323.1 DUF3631 domain-containing protein [Nocardiopsis sp. EMB25]